MAARRISHTNFFANVLLNSGFEVRTSQRTLEERQTPDALCGKNPNVLHKGLIVRPCLLASFLFLFTGKKSIVTCTCSY